MLNRWIAAPLRGGLLDRQNRMRSVTIIGTGPLAHGLAVRVLHARCDVTILGDHESALGLSDSLGTNARSGSPESPITGTIVMLALPYPDVEPFVRTYRSHLTGKIVVDTSNPVDTSSFDGMLTAPGQSAAEHLSTLLDERTPVVKAFNTMSGDFLLDERGPGSPLDVFIASDSEAASAAVGRLVSAAGMNAVNCGPLRRSRELEAMMLLVLTPLGRASGAPPRTSFAVKILTDDGADRLPPDEGNPHGT